MDRDAASWNVPADSNGGFGKSAATTRHTPRPSLRLAGAVDASAAPRRLPRCVGSAGAARALAAAMRALILLRDAETGPARAPGAPVATGGSGESEPDRHPPARCPGAGRWSKVPALLKRTQEGGKMQASLVQLSGGLGAGPRSRAAPRVGEGTPGVREGLRMLCRCCSPQGLATGLQDAPEAVFDLWAAPAGCPAPTVARVRTVRARASAAAAEAPQVDPPAVINPLSSAPPFSLADIRNAIPEHCWERNAWKSFSYLGASLGRLPQHQFHRPPSTRH